MSEHTHAKLHSDLGSGPFSMATLYAMTRLWKPRSNSYHIRRTIAGFVRRGDVLVIGVDARGRRVFRLPEVAPCAS